MSNMAHCRFHNTLADLRDCYNWLGENDPESLSEEEFKAFKRLAKMCSNIADDYGDSDD